jgi:Arc/MetJ-type ribon-helix-helix transcriptional regulator
VPIVLHQFPPDIETLIQAQMASGIYRSQDELLRVALENLAAHDEELSAIRDSIDLLEAGDPGVQLDDAFASLRSKYNLPADA